MLPAKVYLKISVAIFFILLSLQNSFADENIAVTVWQEKSFLNIDGKTSEILIRAKVQNLPAQYTMTSFSLGFGTENKIIVKNVLCDSKPAKHSFSGNNLKVEFPVQKKNGDEFAIYISYSEKYEKINKFLREEAILIPPFAVGANAKVIIGFPGYMESATLNYNITKNGNSFVYQNIVPSDGVTEIIKLTPSQSTWNVVSRVKMKSNQALQDITIELPDYFLNPRQKVENRTVLSSVIPKEKTKKNGKFVFKFASDKNEILIENRAKIFTGKNMRGVIDLKTADYLKYSQQDQEMLDNILQRIKQSQKYQKYPLYAKIGAFTNEFIKYDKSYIGRTPPIRQILQNPVGVCTEYANLYNALARIAGIPSLIINGMACGEDNKCEGHAWNMVYYNNQWIEVDPTWNLMSGIVSSSHVYYSSNDSQSVDISYPGDGRVVNMDVNLSMENVD
jgi:hypothetical protein